jgi:hypothetical protein
MPRTSDYVTTSYNNQNNPATFIDIGLEEPIKRSNARPRNEQPTDDEHNANSLFF